MPQALCLAVRRFFRNTIYPDFLENFYKNISFKFTENIFAAKTAYLTFSKENLLWELNTQTSTSAVLSTTVNTTAAARITARLIKSK